MNSAVPDPTSITPPDLWLSLLKSLGMLCLVLGLLIAVLYMARQIFYRKGGVSGNGAIKMLASYHVAPKERILLLNVLGELILIGVTPQQIQCLAKISADQSIEIPDNRNDASGSFISFVKEAMGRGDRKR